MSDTPKAIGSLAKKQQDVTRQGTQKLKFVPTLPSRRKKEEIKADLSPHSVSTADTGVGKSRSRGIQRKSVEMTASGPFAMGPAPALSSAVSKRQATRSDISSLATSSSSTQTAERSSDFASLKYSGLECQPQCLDLDEDESLFSEPDEDVEVIDLQSVQKLDWTAPESLRRIRIAEKQGKQERYEGASNAITIFNSVSISISISNIFSSTRSCFTRCRQSKALQDEQKSDVVSDIKPPADTGPSTSSTTGNEQLSESKASEAVDGVIGQLEMHRDGIIRIRMTNGIMFDMKSATQPAFPEQVVILNHANHRLIVLGEINKRYVASPNVDVLLEAMDVADRAVGVREIEEGLIAMDTT